MSWRLWVVVLTAGAVGCGLAGRVPAAEESVKPLRLVDSAGNEIVVSNFAERRATAVVFLSSRCPATERSIDAVSRLYEKYRLREVLYIGVCANDVETSEELQSFALNRGLIFSVYRDPQAAVARQLTASKTPEVCLLDQTGRLVYRGGVDSKEGLDALEAAIRQILDGSAVDVAGIPAGGTPIHRPGRVIERTDPFGAPSFSSELIFDRIPGAPSHHCSTITETPDGDLLCVWYGGSYESADDQKLFLSRRAAGRRQWSAPEVVLEDHQMPPGNAVIFVDAHKRLQIVWCRMEVSRPVRRGGGWGRCRLFARSSEDGGRTWSADRMLMADDELVKNNQFFCVTRNPPITLSDGTMVLPLEGPGGGVFLRSADGGQTWNRGGTASQGSQPALIQRDDGSLLTLMRSHPRITMASSTDGARSWTPTQQTDLRNPGSGISMVRLSNGHLVLVYNDSVTDRSPLSIVRSIDEGLTWDTPLQLESNPGEYSYPCVIQTADGRIHITYTFRRYSVKHVELNEDWLTQLTRPN